MRRTLLLAASTVFGLLAATAVYIGRSQVPDEAIRTTVTRLENVLQRACALPLARAFEHRVDWQSNGSHCGPASLANVLRSLDEEADTESKLLDGANGCWFGICPLGLTLDEMARLAGSHSRRKVEVLRDLTRESFREILKDMNDPRRRYVVNFSREPIFGAGVGHISPVGAVWRPRASSSSST